MTVEHSAVLTDGDRIEDPQAATGRLTVRGGWGWLVVPGVVFLGLFLVWPIGGIVGRSLTDPTTGIHNYEQFFQTSVELQSLRTTVTTSILITIICAIIGYIYSYVACRVGPRFRGFLLVAVLLPAWMSLLVRTFAFQLLLRDTGIINRFLEWTGIIHQPLPLIRTPVAVAIGMVNILLPFMVFPIYAGMRQIDPDYELAAATLGATPLRGHLKVFLPIAMPGVAAGSLLVFVSSLGFYITPALLGSGNDLFLSQLVQQHFSQLQWGYGSAIAIILIIFTIVAIGIASKFVKVSSVYGVGERE
jgi:putative spermidine/putrescine transport system permease protein